MRGKHNKNKLIRLFEYGARNSTPDARRIQEMHDLACDLGAECKAMENKPIVETKLPSKRRKLEALKRWATKNT